MDGMHAGRDRFVETARDDAWFAVRVLAFLFGACVLVNVVGALRHPRFDPNIWWVDLRFLPAWGRQVLPGAMGIVLIAYTVRPEMDERRRLLSRVVVGCGLAVALADAIRYFAIWRGGTVEGASPVPVSLVVAATLVVFAVAMRRSRPGPRSSPIAIAAAVAAAFALGVPLLQIAAFGTTDYRRPADAIVVFGAKARPDATPSIVLAERVSRASELYRQGFADIVVMTGGIDPRGIDETLVMRNLAIAQGVPASAIVLDPAGVNTSASVENAVSILEDRGLRTVLAVSQPCHLPRIKLAFARAGLDVWTVPAAMTIVPRTGPIVAREIPAFWLYYLRGALT